MASGPVFVLGGNGFVGSAYVRLLQSQGVPVEIIDRDNYAAMKGRRCAVLINANGNSSKPAAERDPIWDFDASTRSVVYSLGDFPADRYVMLSSGSVYPETATAAQTGEDQAIDGARLGRYGLHKLLAEQAVRGIHKSWLVIRMGNFVGPGLKKNAIFDILGEGQIWLAPQSELQFIHTDNAAQLVWSLVEKGVENNIVNLSGEGVVRLADVHTHAASKALFREGAPVHRFELSMEKLKSLVGDALPSSVSGVTAFVDAVRSGRERLML
jgi:nucleoside-diphosphate-sugar epimerase